MSIMADYGYFSVYVMGSRDLRSPELRWRRQHWCGWGGAQILLFLLVIVLLCGVAIDAYLILHLYQSQSATAASSSKLVGGEEPGYNISPFKPVAHLTDGPDVVHGQQIMAWSENPDLLLYAVGYKNGSLIIQREGYYYVYSKVFFSYISLFHHSICMQTDRYYGENPTLLQASKSSPRLSKTQSNSYLGGVFHLYKGDALHVKVSSTTDIVRHEASENVFGAFMI